MLGAPPSCLRIVTRYVPARTFRSNPSHIDRCRQAVNVIRPGEVRIGHVRIVQVCSGQLSAELIATRLVNAWSRGLSSGNIWRHGF